MNTNFCHQITMIGVCLVIDNSLAMDVPQVSLCGASMMRAPAPPKGTPKGPMISFFLSVRAQRLRSSVADSVPISSKDLDQPAM